MTLTHDESLMETGVEIKLTKFLRSIENRVPEELYVYFIHVP